MTGSARDDRPVVCHVTSVHVPTDSRVLFHECRSLATRYRTVLVCRDDGGARVIEGVEIAPLPRAAGRIARYLGVRELVRAAESTGASVFHFHDPELLPAMAALAGRTGRPVIYDVHEYYPDAMTQKAWIPSMLRPAAALWADRVEKRHSPGMAAIVTADAVLQARFAAMNTRVVELDNYPPLGLFREVRETPPGPPTLVYVGSVSAVRGFFDMVEVLRRVRIQLPDARLVIHGRATEEVVPHLAEVAGDMGADAVELRGAISYRDIAGALAEAHVGLSLLRPHPKYEKNVSMKVFDYMAAGLPYVASDFRPLRDATGGVGGRLVVPGDTAAAAEAVLALLRDPEQARRTGREGRSLVESRLNWERMEPRLFGLYEELLSESGGRASIRR